MPSTPFIGVRSSWLIWARNWDFAASAAIALPVCSASRDCTAISFPSMAWFARATKVA